MTPPPLGAYGVVRTHGVIGWLIRVGTRSRVNHAVIYVGQNDIVEAKPLVGVVISRLAEYRRKDITWTDQQLSAQEANRVVGEARNTLGARYNFADIAALLLLCSRIPTPQWAKARLNWRGSFICSQLVAYCYARAGIILAPSKPIAWVTPGDLLDVIEHRTIPKDR